MLVRFLEALAPFAFFLASRLPLHPIRRREGQISSICRNLMITMTLGGLWHGASWNFAIWGAINGGLLCLERLLSVESKINSELEKRGWSFRLGWSVLMFNLFSFLWIPFRAHSIEEFLGVTKRILSFTPPTAVSLQELVVCGVAFTTIVFCLLDERVNFQECCSRIHPFVKAPALAIIIVASLAFSSEGNQPFIYFRF